MKTKKNVIISAILLLGVTGLACAADVSTVVLGAKKQTLSPDSNIMSAGYYHIGTLSVIDTDLIADNIKSGVVIFGITGTLGSSPGPTPGPVGFGIPDTGQTLCYDVAGAVIPCPAPAAALAQDGSYQPAVSQQNYATQSPAAGTSVTVDNITGLMWVTNPLDALIGGAYTWLNAINACENLNYATYSDWRLPNVKELLSIVNRQNLNPTINTTYFLNTQNSNYWSSTSAAIDPSNFAWFVAFGIPNLGYNLKNNTGYVRCVRGGL